MCLTPATGSLSDKTKAGKMDLPVSTNPFGLTLVIGDDALVWQDTWTAKKKAGSYKFP